MPQIDFYFIDSQGPQAGLLFACRLLEKAYHQQHQVYVHMEDTEKMHFLDHLLWIFRDDSFVPHHLYDANNALSSPIQLGCTPNPQVHHDVLLNLHNEIPSFHAQFSRVLEIVTQEPTMLALAKEHSAFYKEKGYKINSHQLTK